MPFQSGKGVLVAAKVESAFNTAPGATGATVLRLTGGGLTLRKQQILSNEIRADGQTAIPRHGSRNVEGNYACELSVGGFDMLLEAVMRSTWVAAQTITFDGGGALTSLEVLTTSTLQYAGSTGPVGSGLRNGDVFRLASMSNAANNGKNFRVKAISGNVVTVHGTPLTVQAADTACTLTIAKKLKRATVPTKRTFYIDEYNQDIDLSEVFGGCRFTSVKINGTPDGMATGEFGVLGASSTGLASGQSPYFTSPTLPTGQPLVFADALIALGGSDVVVATSFELNLAITAKTEPVVGSSISPDVFDNDARLSGSLTLLRQDLVNLQRYADETDLELHILLSEPEAEPKDHLSIFVPRLKFMGLDKPIGGDGGMIETVQWGAGMKEGVTGYDDTMLSISTSAA
jgi:hypothetical protein